MEASESAPPEQPEQSPLSDAQNTELENWINSEYRAGINITHQQITWYAERALSRDNPSSSLPPNFASTFLSHRPSLAAQLSQPTPPIVLQPPPPQPSDGQPLRGRALLESLKHTNRTRRLFGDSTTNPPHADRTPAPYPEGEVLYQRYGRFIIRHDDGNSVTKITTLRHGLSEGVEEPNEAVAMRFVKAYTSVPVPEVRGSAWDRVTMEYVEGQTLRQAWGVMTGEERERVLGELRGFVGQLRGLTGGMPGPNLPKPTPTPSAHPPIGRLNGLGALLPALPPRSGGPFTSVTDLHHWLVRPPQRIEQQSAYWTQITSHLGATDYPVVFSHADLAARNILVRDGHVVALLDWECAGWYPAYWEYVFAVMGMDRVDWGSLGCEVPGLFPEGGRFDLEYILMNFVLLF
ncbi:kinase-like domain-containing protein [Dichotomopilus funicola]|uniref:Kinase-like domain-containing protein n=1 Tax=Dichotomopilus funicola TaxID=1934379 RepID=A0AAN6UZK8_9PEZI|nr:kinase-like domain-containing protein [Dichotomopilus funicola]